MPGTKTKDLNIFQVVVHCYRVSQVAFQVLYFEMKPAVQESKIRRLSENIWEFKHGWISWIHIWYAVHSCVLSSIQVIESSLHIENQCNVNFHLYAAITTSFNNEIPFFCNHDFNAPKCESICNAWYANRFFYIYNVMAWFLLQMFLNKHIHVNHNVMLS